MFTRLEIQNFKGIQTCEVKDLRRINLFIGKNDSGKSTILEAAYYIFQELYDPPQLDGIMSRRTNVFTGGSELWFRYNTDYSIVISAWFNSLRLMWRLVWLEEEKQVSSQFACERTTGSSQSEIVEIGHSEYRGADFSLRVGGGRMILELPVKQAIKMKIAEYASKMSLIDCTLKSKTSYIEEILGRFKIEGKDEKFGDILVDTYGKGREWEFLPHSDRPSETRLAIREAGKLTYFSDFGDGMRYGLGILGTAMSVKNTALFIEEIESHQHLGSLRKLIKHLVEIARENNLQIFLSTHNYDVWNSLARGVYVDDAEREKEEFRCFVIERDSKSGEVTAESTDDVQKITRALGRP